MSNWWHRLLHRNRMEEPHDADGNLHTKSDPNGKTVTMNYDLLNRVISKTYTDATPPVAFCYDGNTQVPCASAPSGSGNNLIGRLTLVNSSTSSSPYGKYDPSGNIWQSTQTTGVVSYPFSYTLQLGERYDWRDPSLGARCDLGS